METSPWLPTIIHHYAGSCLLRLRQAAWLARNCCLQPFDLQVEYVSGRCGGSSLSNTRNGRSEAGDPDGATNTENHNSIDVCSKTIELPRRSFAEIRTEQLKDREVKAIIDAFEAEAPGDDFARFTQRGYVMLGGVLYRYFPDRGNEEP